MSDQKPCKEPKTVMADGYMISLIIIAISIAWNLRAIIDLARDLLIAK